MEAASKSKIAHLQTIISKMPLEVMCATVLPELEVRWQDVARAVRNSRLPMTAGSVARVLCRHVARSLPKDHVEEVVARLRLKLAATQERKWHLINLLEPTDEEMSVEELVTTLPSRVADALRSTRAGRTARPQVETVLLGDLLYMSVQLASGSVLYVATPPGEPVALVSSLTGAVLRASVQGLGFTTFEDANLHGRDAASLLRINNRAYTDRAEHLAAPPPYQPAPVVTATGVDFTNKTYDLQYVDNIIGPDPPLLTDLTIVSKKAFFDPSRLQKQVTMSVRLRSSDVAGSLRQWVARGALAPTSELLRVFRDLRANQLHYGE